MGAPEELLKGLKEAVSCGIVRVCMYAHRRITMPCLTTSHYRYVATQQQRHSIKRPLKALEGGTAAGQSVN